MKWWKIDRYKVSNIYSFKRVWTSTFLLHFCIGYVTCLPMSVSFSCNNELSLVNAYEPFEDKNNELVMKELNNNNNDWNYPEIRLFNVTAQLGFVYIGHKSDHAIVNWNVASRYCVLNMDSSREETLLMEVPTRNRSFRWERSDTIVLQPGLAFRK